jgi:hypothetical protein
MNINLSNTIAGFKSCIRKLLVSTNRYEVGITEIIQSVNIAVIKNAKLMEIVK